MLATVAHKSHILGLHQCLVVSFVPSSMGHGGRTGEHLQMEVARADNYTPVVEEIDSWVAQIECLCLVYFQRCYLMLPDCHLGIVGVTQTGHPVKRYWLSSVEIHSSTSYVNKRFS